MVRKKRKNALKTTPKKRNAPADTRGKGVSFPQLVAGMAASPLVNLWDGASRSCVPPL